MPTLPLASIESFQEVRRIALIGVSRDAKSYSRELFTALQAHGYEVFPVHPQMTQVEGVPCHPDVKAIQPAPERAIILLSRERTAQAIDGCAEAGVAQVWLRRTVRDASVAQAMDRGMTRGMTFIVGLCPFLFLPKAAFPHRLHGSVLKLVGAYPR